MTLPTETLGQKQRRFAQAVAALILQAARMGYEVALGDAYRDPRVFGPIGTRMGYGESRSAHKQRLAIDLNLFKDGVYLPDTEAHRQLGEWWEHSTPDAVWGGRFQDGNHYSIRHDGIS